MSTVGAGSLVTLVSCSSINSLVVGVLLGEFSVVSVGLATLRVFRFVKDLLDCLEYSARL
jgi:hypothetical protein